MEKGIQRVRGISNLATSTAQTDGSQVTKIKEVVPTDALKTNGTLAISNTGPATSTKTLTQVIGGVTYTSTLSYNAAGDFLSMTAWS